MRTEDFNYFAKKWTDAGEVSANGKIMSQGAMVFAFEALQQFELDDICKALTIHCQRNKFAPTPNDILEIITGGSRHLSADEAWAIALMSMDENETVVMTKEISEARAIAWEVYSSGDDIGARMAFRDAYNRIIKQSCTEPSWFVSVGYDKSRTVDAVRKAVSIGRLPQQEINKYLLEAPKDAGPIAGLLTGKVTELPNNAAHLKNRWSELKTAINDGAKRMEMMKAIEIENVKQQKALFEQRKAKQLEKIQALTGEIV